VESLEKVETEGVAPMSHVLEVKNVWKKDIPSKKDISDGLLSNAPMIEKGYFKVPKILED
jgi:aspartyl/glutamyl-tRNA(Asn/Gln) amidotransferase C subunit